MPLPWEQIQQAPAQPPVPQPFTIPGTGNPAASVMLPKAQADLAGTQVDTATKAAGLPYVAPLAAAKLQDTQSAAADAAAKQQQQADQHALKDRAQAVLDDATTYAILPTIDQAVTDVQRPLATGTLAKALSPFSFGDYGTNANFVAKELEAIKTNTAMQNILSERAMSPTGSNGMRVTQTEFNKFGNAWGNLDQDQPAPVLQKNLQTIRTIFRNAVLRGHGIDPATSNLLAPPPGFVPPGQGAAANVAPAPAPSTGGWRVVRRIPSGAQ